MLNFWFQQFEFVHPSFKFKSLVDEFRFFISRAVDIFAQVEISVVLDTYIPIDVCTCV